MPVIVGVGDFVVSELASIVTVIGPVGPSEDGNGTVVAGDVVATC